MEGTQTMQELVERIYCLMQAGLELNCAGLDMRRVVMTLQVPAQGQARPRVLSTKYWQG